MDKIYKCTATYNNYTIVLGYTKHPNIMREYYIYNPIKKPPKKALNVA